MPPKRNLTALGISPTAFQEMMREKAKFQKRQQRRCLDPEQLEKRRKRDRERVQKYRHRLAQLDPERLKEIRERDRLRQKEARLRLAPEKLDEIRELNRQRMGQVRHRATSEDLKEIREKDRLKMRKHRGKISGVELQHHNRRKRIINIFYHMCGETKAEAFARRQRDGRDAFKKYKSLHILPVLDVKPASQVESGTEPQTSGTIVTNPPTDALSSTNELDVTPKSSTSRIVIEDSQEAERTVKQFGTANEENSTAMNENEVKEEFDDYDEFFVRKGKSMKWGDEDCWLDYDSHVDGTFQKRRIDETISEWTLRVCGNEDEDSNGQNPILEGSNSKAKGNKEATLRKAKVNNNKYPSHVIETEEERAQRWKDELERRIAYYCNILGEKKGEEVVEEFKKRATDAILHLQRFIYNPESKLWEEQEVVIPKKPVKSKSEKEQEAREKLQIKLANLTPEEIEAQKAKLSANATMKIRMDKEEWRIFEILTSLDPLIIVEDETALEAMEWWINYHPRRCPIEVKEWRKKLYPLFISKSSETETEDEKFQRYEKIMETINECVTSYTDIVKEYLLTKKEYGRNISNISEEEKELNRLKSNALYREKYRRRKGLPPLENCQPVKRKRGRQKRKEMTEEEIQAEKQKWDSYMRERYRSKKDDPSFSNEYGRSAGQSKRSRMQKTDYEDTSNSAQTCPKTAPIAATMGETSTSSACSQVVNASSLSADKEVPQQSSLFAPPIRRSTRRNKGRKGKRQATMEWNTNTVGDDDSMENNYDDHDDHDHDDDWTPIASYEIDAMLQSVTMDHHQVIGNSMELNLSSAPLPSNAFPFNLNQFPSVVQPRSTEHNNQGHFINELNASSSSAFLTPTHLQQQQQIFQAHQQPLLPAHLGYNVHNMPNSLQFYNQPQQHQSFPSHGHIPWNQNYLAPTTTPPLNYSSQLIPNPQLQKIPEGDSTRSLRNRSYTVVDNVQEKATFEQPTSSSKIAEGTTEKSAEDAQEQSSCTNDPIEALLEMKDKQRPMCPHCSKYFETQAACDKHVKKVHESPIPFACKLCCRGFPNSKDLIHHIWTSHYDGNQDCLSPRKNSPNESMHFCSFCGILVKWSDHLNLHTLLFHPKKYEEWTRSDNSVEKDQIGSNEGVLFSCETCDSEFCTDEFLVQHKTLVGHSNPNKSVLTFKCTSCHKKFSSKTLRDYHYIQDCSLRIIKCLQCEESFPSHTILQEHVLVVHSKNSHKDADIVVPSPPKSKNKKEYKCELCKKSYGKTSAFLSHFSRQHWNFLVKLILEKSAPAISVTEEQGTSSLTSTDLSASTSVETSSTNVMEAIKQFVCTCTVCQNYFTGKTIHDIHKAYQKICAKKCDVCDKQFVKTSSLLKHKIEVHQIDDKTARLVEAVCNAQDENPGSAMGHSNTEDVSTRSVMCTICFVSLSPNDFHKQHKTVGSYSDPAIKSCNFCEQKLIGSFNLLRHVRQFHSGRSGGGSENTSQTTQSVSSTSNSPIPFSLSNRIVVYPCIVCHTIFNSQQFLAVHLESKHPEVKVAEGLEPHGLCELCNKTFSHVENLIKHRKEVHEQTTDELANKEFHCNICSKVFGQEGKLKAHMGNVHFPQHFNTFCQFCGKQMRPEYIRRHTRFYHPEHAASITKFESLKMPLVKLLQLLGDVQDGNEKTSEDEKRKEIADGVGGNACPTEDEDCIEVPVVLEKSVTEECASEHRNEINELVNSLSSSPWPVVRLTNCDNLVQKYAKDKEVYSASKNNSDKSTVEFNKSKNKGKVTKKKGKNAPKSKLSKVKRGRKSNNLPVPVDPEDELFGVIVPTCGPVRRSQRRRGDTHFTSEGKDVNENAVGEIEENEGSLEHNKDEGEVITLSDSEIKDEPVFEDLLEESTEMEGDLGSWCLFPIPESQDEDDEETLLQDPLNLPCYANNWTV